MCLTRLGQSRRPLRPLRVRLGVPSHRDLGSDLAPLWLAPAGRPTADGDAMMALRETRDDAGSGRILRDDPRYRAVVDKRFNKRFTASPDYVRLVHSADEVVSAVQH